MATLSIDDQLFTELDKITVHSEESPTELARFLLAASLYHAQKMSFHAAANLSGLGFNGFKKRLKEYFSTGYVIAPEVVDDDLAVAKRLSTL